MKSGPEPEVAKIVAGPFQTNTYLLRSGDEAVIIDPGWVSSTYLDGFHIDGFKVKAVIATHGHMDHLFDIADLKSSLGCNFFMGSGDGEVLKWSHSVSEKYMGKPLQEVETDRFLKEGESIGVGSCKLEVVELPGHTPGSIGLITGNLFFTGDTLFMGTIGRTDLGGSMEQMNKTLGRIRKMDPGLRILPGHGPESTLSQELKTNPFLA